MDTDILQQQIAYYRARAGEYDEWFYRVGRYDRGVENNQRWFDEVEKLMQAVEGLGKVEHVLELACGTGIWTHELAKIAEYITAVDASAEVIEINREKVRHPNTDYIEGDLFTWQPDKEYDLVFMSFWMSHVPPEKLDGFLKMVKRATKPGGRVFMIDSMPDDTSTVKDHVAYQPEDVYHTRKLNDGREFTIVKVFYEPDILRQKLAEYGFEAEVNNTGRYFWWANGVKTKVS